MRDAVHAVRCAVQHRRCGDAADAKARTQTPTEALEAQELTVAAAAAAAARRKEKKR